MDNLTIENAFINNLKNLNLKIPRNKLVVFTGISGSGKSSLAFDTIFKEGQKRFLDSFTNYSRVWNKTEDDFPIGSLKGLSPSIAIDQKSSINNPRSTVGTVTEIYDYIKLLYTHLGIAHSPLTKKPISPQPLDDMLDQLYSLREGTKMVIMAPVWRQRKGVHREILDKYESLGFNKIYIDNKFFDIDEDITIDKKKYNSAFLVIDRVIKKSSNKDRLKSSFLEALKIGKKFCKILINDSDALDFSQTLYCEQSNTSFPELTPKVFSYNSINGQCPTCKGIGSVYHLNTELFYQNYQTPLLNGPIGPILRDDEVLFEIFEHFISKNKININDNFVLLPPKQKEMILYGDGSSWIGLEEYFLHYLKESSFQFLIDHFFIELKICDSCQGSRLAPFASNVKFKGLTILDINKLNLDQLHSFFIQIKLTPKESTLAKGLIKEIVNRSEFLCKVGLNYLTLDRSASSLSGGELQRIRLATQLGSFLSGVLYVLDEPSIGLHQRDNIKLIDTIKKLRDNKNSVIVVEHDEDTIKSADYIVDFGPLSGINGGKIVAFGTPNKLRVLDKSLTLDYLKGIKKIPIKTNFKSSENFIHISGAQKNNIINTEFKVPLKNFVCVTGVSGSGKSTLVNQILLPLVRNQNSGIPAFSKLARSFSSDITIDSVVHINQKPIGRTPKSVPATYIGIFSYIRKIFGSTKESKLNGFNAGHFSFNTKQGRCETCEGNGYQKIEVNFLSDSYQLCEDCQGKRYTPEILNVYYKGKNIDDVLNLTVEQALSFFSNHPSIFRHLKFLKDVGLDYIKLGQSSTTLSGGEAQRIKLGKELSKLKQGHCLYFLDEPSTGLHFHDISKLLSSIQGLVDKGNSVIVIEHNLDIIQSSDYIIDMGPEGGHQGGRILATGTPKEVSQKKESITGIYLKKYYQQKKPIS
jgi:excinuclease ABC subunit A